MGCRRQIKWNWPLVLHGILLVMRCAIVEGRPFLADPAQAHSQRSVYGTGEREEELLADNRVEGGAQVEEVRGMNTVGSRPPSCKHKCGYCRPCAAIQVPTTITNGIGLQHYPNYEPEGWKCKCGSFFYNP